MSRLFLVRHGQASFFDQDYDKLSPTGEVQSRLLGQYWARHNISFDRAFSEPRARQRDTASIVTETYHRAGPAFPETVVLPEFDEYRGDAVLEQGLPRLLESDTRIHEFHQILQQSADEAERLKNFQRLFEVVIGKWVDGAISLPDVGSWPEFCARVNRGLSGIFSGSSRGEQIAVFCSGRPIGVAMQRALNLSPRDTLRVVWMSRNSILQRVSIFQRPVHAQRF